MMLGEMMIGHCAQSRASDKMLAPIVNMCRRAHTKYKPLQKYNYSTTYTITTYIYYNSRLSSSHIYYKCSFLQT